jgi:glycosyltransferase involved in cell wall biosynthesis
MVDFNIIFRSCDREFRQTDRSVPGTKADIVQGCLTSVISSCVEAMKHVSQCDINYKLTVIDDHSNEDTVRKIESLLEKFPGPKKLLTTPQQGNGASIGFNFDYARDHCSGLLYFVEDDYIHLSHAIVSMTVNWFHFQRIFQQDVVLFPVDYPDRYWFNVDNGIDSPTQLYLGVDQHWRTIKCTTGTYLMSHETLCKYWDVLSPFRRYGIDHSISEATTINKVYEQVPCLSPVPTLAEHIMGKGHTSPYVDWLSVWQNICLKEPT